MADQIVHALAHGGDVRIVAISATATVETARRLHGSAPAAAIALGELLMATALMARMLKGSQRLTIQVQANGSLGLLLARADRSGTLYGTVMYPQATVPLDAQSRPDVGAAIGRGTLVVHRDAGSGEPWLGFVPVDGGELADEIRAYFATSEQTASAVGLRVELDDDGKVVAAGGFVAQLLGGLADERRAELKPVLHAMHQSRDWLRDEFDASSLARLIGGDDTRVVETVGAEYNCPVDRDYYIARIASLGKAAIDELFADDATIEVTCEFTRKSWTIQRAEIDRVVVTPRS